MQANWVRHEFYGKCFSSDYLHPFSVGQNYQWRPVPQGISIYVVAFANYSTLFPLLCIIFVFVQLRPSNLVATPIFIWDFSDGLSYIKANLYANALAHIKTNPRHFLVKHLMPNKTDVAVCGKHLMKQVFKCTLICTLFCQQNSTEPCRYKKTRKIFDIISSRISSCVKSRNSRKLFLLCICLLLLCEALLPWSVWVLP